MLIDAAKAAHRECGLIRVDVFGSGDSSKFAFDDIAIEYCGRIPFGSGQETISKYDLMVLPSQFDGWGVVVNEALMAEVPVLCSNRVGAASLIRKWKCGAVFSWDNSNELAALLISIALNRDLLRDMSAAAKLIAPSITPQVAGRYMFDAIRSTYSLVERPVCPWY
jgi:glycosyltransferase involved in cell wall biosynthesis